MNSQKTAWFLFGVLFIVFTFFCTFRYLNPIKPLVVVDMYGNTPEYYFNNLETPNPANKNLFSEEDLKKKFLFVYISTKPVFGDNNPDKDKYEQKHPEDKIVKSGIGDQRYEIIVFSNSPDPDPKFFEVAND